MSNQSLTKILYRDKIKGKINEFIDHKGVENLDIKSLQEIKKQVN